MQPGDSIQPSNASDEPTWQYRSDAQTDPNQPIPPDNQPSLAPIDNPASPAPPIDSGDGISWTASEFIAHQKSAGWYMILFLVAVVFAGLVYLLTRDPVSTGVVIVFAIIFAIVAARRPRELQYRVDDQGVQIGEKNYGYSLFRSFAVVHEDGVESIWFMPLKRFMPIMSIYFDPKDSDQIVGLLNRNLPIEDHKLDPVDRLMHRIRF